MDRIQALMRGGRHEEAEAALLKLLEDEGEAVPRDEATYALAVSRRYLNRFEAARETIESLLAVKPDYGRAHQELGYLNIAMKHLPGAVAAFAEAVRLNPALLASWKALAHLHHQAGHREETRLAVIQAEYLEKLPPELLGAMDLMHEGKLFKAENLCRQFMLRNRRHIEGMRLLAEIGLRLKVLDDAEFLLESCVEFAPDHLGARMDYLKILNRKSKFQKAMEQAQHLLKVQPGNPAFQLAEASALTGLGRFEEGLARFKACLGNSPNPAGIHMMMGHAQKAVGRLEDAIASYQAAYRIREDYGDAYWSLANTKTYRFSDEELERMRRLTTSDGVAEDDRVHLAFALGKALEDRKIFEESYHNYEYGNALKQRRSGYDPDRTTAMVEAQELICSRDLFQQRENAGHWVPDPIFIVGLPRAGSTLLEQILASHSQVDGTMELHNILGLAQRLRGRSAEAHSRYPKILWELEESYFERFGRQFIEQTQVYRQGAPRFIDKMPNNFLHIGLIRLILPQAKIIDARRHPMSCCFSGYKQLFGEGQDFTYSQESMGRYYRDYVRLMDHWDAVLPGAVLRVNHEDLIEDPEGQIRRMLHFCELPFEEACLNFHENQRSVRTPSSEQVRQPINRKGVDQWRNFEPWLGPLKEALGKPLCRRYGIQDIPVLSGS